MSVLKDPTDTPTRSGSPVVPIYRCSFGLSISGCDKRVPSKSQAITLSRPELSLEPVHAPCCMQLGRDTASRSRSLQDMSISGMCIRCLLTRCRQPRRCRHVPGLARVRVRVGSGALTIHVTRGSVKLHQGCSHRLHDGIKVGASTIGISKTRTVRIPLDALPCPVQFRAVWSVAAAWVAPARRLAVGPRLSY